MSGFCSDPLNAYPIHFSFRDVGSFTIVIACCYIFMGLFSVYLIKLQEWRALTFQDMNPDIVDSPKSIVFPVFEKVLWINSIIIISAGLIYLIFPYEPNDEQNSLGVQILFAAVFASEHLVMEGVAFLLMRKGLGWNAANKVLVRTIVWSLFVFACNLISYIYSKNIIVNIFFGLIWQVILLLFYAALWLAPPKILFRRPAALFYARFWTIFRFVAIITVILESIPRMSQIGSCIEVFGVLIIFAFTQPLIIFVTLLRDSMWWQGMKIRTGYNHRSIGQTITAPLDGLDLNLKSAQTLAQSVDNMIKEEIKLLNFAYLELDRDHLLGSGSFSKVYRGNYKKKVCAIKVIFTVDLTEEIINRVGSEAHILSLIKHPNVINIFGVCVLPPSVCLVLELCDLGSLNNIVNGNGLDDENDNKNKHQYYLSTADRLYLALGCARGLAALHGFSEELCHRDVKSFNFLVDRHMNVKIADLELGILPTDNDTPNPPSNKNDSSTGNKNNKIIDDKSKDHENSMQSSSHSSFSISFTSKNEKGSDIDSVLSSLDLDARGSKAHFGVWKNEILPNWAAPEVIQTGRHIKPSDVYSLALVLWEIISGKVPYGDIPIQAEIRRMILQAEKPTMPLTVLKASNDISSIWFNYANLIYKGWQSDPKQRITVFDMLNELEYIWKSIGQDLIQETDIVPDVSKYINIASEEHRKQRNDSVSSQQNGSIVGTISSHGGSLSFSWTGLRRPSTANPTMESLKEEFNAEVIRVIASDPNYEKLELSGEPWCVVTAQSPHLLVYTTTAFQQLCGISATTPITLPTTILEEDDDKLRVSDDILKNSNASGVYAAGASLFSIMKGKMTEEGVLEKFSSNLAEENGFGHTLITLHKGVVAGTNASSSRVSFTARYRRNQINSEFASKSFEDEYSIYSIHSYPIRRRQSLSTSSSVERDLSTETNHSYDVPISVSPKTSFFAASMSGFKPSMNSSAAISALHTRSRLSSLTSAYPTNKTQSNIAYYALLFHEFQKTSRKKLPVSLNKSHKDSGRVPSTGSSSIRNLFYRPNRDDSKSNSSSSRQGINSTDTNLSLGLLSSLDRASIGSSNQTISPTSISILRGSIRTSVRHPNSMKSKADVNQSDGSQIQMEQKENVDDVRSPIHDQQDRQDADSRHSELSPVEVSLDINDSFGVEC